MPLGGSDAPRASLARKILMRPSCGLFWPLLSAWLAPGAARATVYTATILQPTGAIESSAFAVGGGGQVGYVRSPASDPLATLRCGPARPPAPST